MTVAGVSLEMQKKFVIKNFRKCVIFKGSFKCELLYYNLY